MFRKRKITGKKYSKKRKKKKYEGHGQKIILKLGDEDKRKIKRIRGGNEKVVLLKASSVNVKLDNKKMKKVKIKNILKTPSNRFLAMQNIITKGAIVETEIGNVKITSRPTQEGILNGVLVE